MLVVASTVGFLFASPALSQNKIGTEPVALVENIEQAPEAGVEFMDYLYPQQRVRLGKNGRLTLSYLQGCLVDVIRGGSVLIAGDKRTGGSLVTGGVLKVNSIDCQQQHAAITAETSEAGATVKRLFPNMLIREKSINTIQPYFRLPKDKPGLATVTVYDLEQGGKPRKPIWRKKTEKRFFQYDTNKNRFRRGMPYLAEAVFKDGTTAVGIFSYDPELNLSDRLVAKTILLDPPKVK